MTSKDLTLASPRESLPPPAVMVSLLSPPEPPSRESLLGPPVGARAAVDGHRQGALVDQGVVLVTA